MDEGASAGMKSQQAQNMLARWALFCQEFTAMQFESPVEIPHDVEIVSWTKQAVIREQRNAVWRAKVTARIADG